MDKIELIEENRRLKEENYIFKNEIKSLINELNHYKMYCAELKSDKNLLTSIITKFIDTNKCYPQMLSPSNLSKDGVRHSSTSQLSNDSCDDNNSTISSIAEPMTQSHNNEVISNSCEIYDSDDNFGLEINDEPPNYACLELIDQQQQQQQQIQNRTDITQHNSNNTRPPQCNNTRTESILIIGDSSTSLFNNRKLTRQLNYTVKTLSNAKCTIIDIINKIKLNEIYVEKPSFIVLFLGINDIQAYTNAEQAFEYLLDLVNLIRDYNNTAQIVITTLPYFETSNSLTDDLNDCIDEYNGLIKAFKQANNKNLSFNLIELSSNVELELKKNSKDQLKISISSYTNQQMESSVKNSLMSMLNCNGYLP